MKGSGMAITDWPEGERPREKLLQQGVAALSDAERPARVTEYKKEIDKLLRQELDLEEQLLDNDNAKAADTLTAMTATMREGHTGFRPARGRGPGGGAPGGAPGGGAPGGGAGGGRRGGGAPPTP